MNSNHNSQYKQEFVLFFVTINPILTVNERVFVITSFYYVFPKKSGVAYLLVYDV